MDNPTTPNRPVEGKPSVVAPPAPSPLAAATNALSNVVTTAKDTVASVKEAVAKSDSTPVASDGAVSGFMSKMSSKLRFFVYLGIGIALIALTAFILYWAINRTVNKRRSYRLAESDTPLLGTVVSNLPAAVPDSRSGKRQTFAFWIYLYDLEKFRGQYRHVWHRGDRTDRWDKASPAVYLDKDSNKLHITLGTEKIDPFEGIDVKAATEDQKYAIIRQLRGITIDYVPLQRWVHVAIVVNEDVNNGSITAYVDGELTKVVTSEKAVPLPVAPNKVARVRLSIQSSNLNKKGNVFVGGNPTDEMGPGFSGLVSRIAFFNYDLNSKDIHSEYTKGPVGHTAGKIGYGVRSPVYRVG